MHFEILVEDASGDLLLSTLLPKILGENGTSHTWRTHAYKGIGRIPRDLRGKTDPSKRILLDRLPKVLAGYGRSLQRSDSAVVVVVDLDDRECAGFKQELLQVSQRCHPKPRVLFRFAIEEIEAWLLGDRNAILKEFPRAKVHVLDSYIQDSVCGTWETLADAVFPGGSPALKAEGWPRIGQEKCKWASQIGRHLNVESNLSPSLRVFRGGVLKMSGADVQIGETNALAEFSRQLSAEFRKYWLPSLDAFRTLLVANPWTRGSCPGCSAKCRNLEHWFEIKVIR